MQPQIQFRQGLKAASGIIKRRTERHHAGRRNQPCMARRLKAGIKGRVQAEIVGVNDDLLVWGGRGHVRAGRDWVTDRAGRFFAALR